MPAERYFHPDFFEENLKIHFKEQENHHLTTVMRTKIGEAIEIVNGKGQLAKALLDSIDKKSSTLIVKEVQTAPQPTQQLILAQAIPKLNRLDFIIEKCTELGVTDFWLFPGARSEKKDFSDNQLERINALMTAAMKQCGRLFLPKLTLLQPLKQWKDVYHSLHQTLNFDSARRSQIEALRSERRSPAPRGQGEKEDRFGKVAASQNSKFDAGCGIDDKTLFYGDIHPDAPPFLTKWKELNPSNDIMFCIGPEAGFTDEEESYLKKLGAHGVKLHNNILRTDTAAIVSIALLSYIITIS